MVISSLSLEEVERVYERIEREISQHGAPQPEPEQEGQNCLNRFQRRQKTASECLKFDIRNNLGVAPPRPLVLLSQEHAKQPLIFEGLEFDHKVQVEMRSKEHDNLFGHSTRQDDNDALLFRKSCSNKDECGCEGGHAASFSTKRLKWRYFSVKEHNEACKEKQQSTKHAHSVTPYTYLDLALIPAAQEATNVDIMIPSKILHSILADFIVGKLHNNKMLNLRRQLQKQLIGSASDAARRLPRLMKILEDDGHSVDVQIVDSTTVQTIMMKQRQSQFERQQKNESNPRKWADVREEESANVKDLFKDDDSSTQYVVGWHIVFRTSKAMIQHLINVYFTDATFMRSSLGGALYLTVGVDANHHVVPVGLSWFWGGESSLGWTAHCKFVSPIIPPGSRIIIDGTIAGISALEEQLPHAEIFLCALHFAKTIKKASVKRFFEVAVKAKTIQELNAYKANITAEEYNSLVEKHTPARLVMVERLLLHGFSTQSLAESTNKAILEARGSYNHIGKSMSDV